MRSDNISTPSAGAEVPALATTSLSWEAWRIIPSRFPPVDLYRRVAPPEDWPLLIEVETLTNPRVREVHGGLGLVRPEDKPSELELVRPEDKIGKATQNWIIAPFTYPDPEGSRFSNGSFGVSIQAELLETALLESIRRRETFLMRTAESPVRLDMRVIRTRLSGLFDDVRGRADLEDLAESRKLGFARREAGSNGIVYTSDLHPGGTCVAVFRPRVLSEARQERHFAYVWNAKCIEQVYDYSLGAIIDVDHLRVTGAIRHIER